MEGLVGRNMGGPFSTLRGLIRVCGLSAQVPALPHPTLQQAPSPLPTSSGAPRAQSVPAVAWNRLGREF